MNTLYQNDHPSKPDHEPPALVVKTLAWTGIGDITSGEKELASWLHEIEIRERCRLVTLVRTEFELVAVFRKLSEGGECHG